MSEKARRRSLEIIIKDGKPRAVILDIDEYQAMLERLEDIDDLKMLQEMRKKPLEFWKLEEFNKDQESFVRWQKVTLKQLGYVANLLLALATGLLAFQSNLLLRRDLASCCAFGFAIASVFLLTLSVGFAIWCSVNRLRNFRLTMQIARRRERGETGKELQQLRDKSSSLGEITWKLFWFQISLFAIGAGCSVIAVFIQVFGQRIYSNAI